LINCILANIEIRKSGKSFRMNWKN